ncbi:MAG: MlaD family protein [Myxococcales bacterium]|nr:MlaD family protein [Myxococcales bacterium]
MKKVFTPFRVGLLVLVALGILFGFLTFSKKGGMDQDAAVEVYAYFKDASGLGKKSRVQIAGIPVGEIISIELIGLRAKVTIRIKKEIGVRRNASLTKRSESLLGDYLIDLAPGTEDQPPILNGEEIVSVLDAPGMEAVMGSIQLIAQDVQQVTRSLRNVLGGEKGQASLESIVANLTTLTAAVDKTIRDSATRLDQILNNVEGISGDIRKMTTKEQASISSIVANIDAISRDVRDVMASVKRVVGENEGEVQGGVTNVKETLAKLDRTLANVEEVSKNIKDGKGTVGALLSDERLGQKLSDTIEDVSDFAGRLTGMELELGVRTDYLVNQGAAKIFISGRLMPKPDKYYLIEAVDDPRGSVETIILQNNPPAAGEPAVQKQLRTRETLKFSAMFAKRYSFLTLRLGIIESTGGVGLDLNVPIKFFYYSRWLEDALVVKVDAFNFSVEQLTLPRLRATVRFTPFEHVYVNVGIDDALNAPNRDSLTNKLISGRDFFVGAGVYFTDQDLKSLLPLLPSP